MDLTTNGWMNGSGEFSVFLRIGRTEDDGDSSV